MAHLQQDAARLGRGAHVEALQVGAAVGDHEHDVQLPRPKAGHVIVLGAVPRVPGGPLGGERRRVAPAAHARAVRLHEARGRVARRRAGACAPNPPRSAPNCPFAPCKGNAIFAGNLMSDLKRRHAVFCLELSWAVLFEVM